MTARDMLTESGLEIINQAKTLEDWLELSKFYPKRNLRRYLLIP
ncbi:26569_t:CDS:1, partial [Gigaspora margarita]